MQKRKAEREDYVMKHNVNVESKMTVSVGKVLDEYWRMCGMKRINSVLSTCKEKEVAHNPSLKQIAQFLEDSGADYVAVEHCYRFVDDLPFN